MQATGGKLSKNLAQNEGKVTINNNYNSNVIAIINDQQKPGESGTTSLPGELAPITGTSDVESRTPQSRTLSLESKLV